MRVKTFVAKLSVESVHDMDSTISKWLERHKVTPTMVTQTIGDEKGHDGRPNEPVLVTSVWYEQPKEED